MSVPAGTAPRQVPRQQFLRLRRPADLRDDDNEEGPDTVSTQSNHLTGFGPNEWLVEEMYQQYLADPDSVDAAWHEFFVDYRAASPGNGRGASNDARDPDPGEPAEPAAPAAKPATPKPATTKAAATKTTATKPAAKPAAASTGKAREPVSDDDAASSESPEDAPAASDPELESTATQVAVDSDARPPVEAPAAPATARSGSGETPTKPAATATTSAATAPTPAAPKPAKAKVQPEPGTTQIRGAAARIVTNMDASLSVPTATSVRAFPAKLLADNRIVINNHLRRSRGGKVSFTHLIGFALTRAIMQFPEMNSHFTVVDGKPAVVVPEDINLGLAIDLPKPDGTRTLVVAALKGCQKMDFGQFWSAYEDMIRRARSNKLTTDDFAGVTISLTNPGTIGTNHSVPRLMQGQGTIVGVGAMEYPAQFQGMSEETLASLAVGKTITLTSTYDHRIIQGAVSGDFLRVLHRLLLGEDGFYDGVFKALRIPYEPVRWVSDVTVTHEGQIDKNARVIELINAYRSNGHLMADTDPLDSRVRTHPDLDVLTHGLTLWDLDRSFPVGGFAGEQVMRLRDILGVLRNSYCRTVGVEYMHITDPQERAWLQERIEVKYEQVDAAEQKHILGRLNAAEAFENFLQTKYVGQKRFSLEGAESTIPMLDAVLQTAAEHSLDEVAIGMPHRGRLNVLANILGKSYTRIFGEFEGNIDPGTMHGSGDVKYHLGATGTFKHPARDASVTVSLASNPSHLEAVNPVLEGIVRAKQDLINKGEAGFTVMSVLMHGDSAFAGQGVVAETLNLSQLRGYRTGGTVHLIVNNQVGFTTSPAAARSSLHSTDVARMIQAPIFHVNGDDPEACVRVSRFAVEYRQAFRKDVVVDLVCYRRRGHNEGDDPSMTQPLMYDVIDKKRSVRKLYTESLIGRGDIGIADAEEALRDYQGRLERAFAETRDFSGSSKPEPVMAESPREGVRTAIAAETLKCIADAHVSLPEGFTVHPKLKKVLDRRAAMATEGAIDWSFAEILAFGSSLMDGVPVRLAGQDSRRGTFVQRHAVLIDRKTAAEYTPVANLEEGQARFWAYDSLLSEYAAMGFEYGYSVANRKALVLWEAQFGDFADGAQIIIDEFISSGEAKWGQRSGVVLLLPHGSEGQGPDHSSGRIERYLQMCAEDNMTVANCSTPANYF
ncbi:MAG: multifunctional oxoglutarate decarboxylase/oxoglutarate dehydrogenase thiamine pyrophosphate-binding subunit/dihydrolipoyllysine-residue succinyltransferase subunit, partial [Geodermatophilaceae bacterium]|nr:multifunctional oxoglutarate decarboxylase/oxoglutarate dehydrogenase thiamine pyrophosphate-binding subunit/dihydrolipoyllysine-residue succinyltransferase subunit [Geodermatophilaceae bacterium]